MNDPGSEKWTAKVPAKKYPHQNGGIFLKRYLKKF